MKYLPLLEKAINRRSRNMNLYVEFTSLDDVSDVIAAVKSLPIRINEIDINRSGDHHSQRPSAILFVRMDKKETSHYDVIARVQSLENVVAAEEL